MQVKFLLTEFLKEKITCYLKCCEVQIMVLEMHQLYLHEIIFYMYFWIFWTIPMLLKDT